MTQMPWDQRAARILVRPLARTPVTPNQITVFTLLLALAGSALIATGRADLIDLGAGLFVLGRFLDHFDGELARLTGKTSRLGYWLDYIAGAISYAAFYLGAGIGLQGGWLGEWSLWLGVLGAAGSLASLFFTIGIDTAERGAETVDAEGYPGFAGFELEDAMYLIAPIAWAGWLPGFFLPASLGAGVYALWMGLSMLRARARATPRA